MSANKWFPNAQRRPDARLQLFCFPFAGGGASAFRGWQEHLPPWVEVWPVEYPGHESRFREPALEDAGSLANAIVTELASAIRLPFGFFGHSMGALLAFETAKRLRELKRELPLHLFVSGHGAPHLPPARPPVSGLPDREFREELRLYGGTPKEVLANDELMQLLSPLLRRDLRICERYQDSRQAPLDVPFTAFGGADDPTVPWHRLTEWSAQTNKRFCAYVLPGEHFFIRKAVPSVCERIGRHLEVGNLSNPLIPPTGDEVHLWRVDLDAPEAVVTRCRAVLSGDELERAEVMPTAEERGRAIVARGALRILLGRYGVASAEKLEFADTPSGTLVGIPPLPVQFDMAQSGSLALIAVAHGQAVGVDLAHQAATSDEQIPAGAFFAPSELTELAQRGAARRKGDLLELRVRKTALLRSLGSEVPRTPQAVHVGLPPLPGAVRTGFGAGAVTSPRGVLQSFAPAPEYVSALALGRGFARIVWGTWPADIA